MWSTLLAVPLLLTMVACGGSRSEEVEETSPAPIPAEETRTEDTRAEETSRVATDTLVTTRTVVDTTIITIDTTVAVDTTFTVDTTFSVDTARVEGGRGEIVDTTQ